MADQDSQDANFLDVPMNSNDPPQSSPHSRKKQVLATFCATLGCLLNGAVIGFTGPALPSLLNITGHSNDGWSVWGDHMVITAQEASWITGMLSIGSFIGCLLAGVCMERWGRRFSLMVITSLSYLIGFICILLAHSAVIIFLGRFFNGVGLGFVLSTATIYIVEIASTDMRGVLGCFIQFMGGFGVLLTFILGYWLNWWQLAAAKMVLVIPFIMGMYLVPESPHWYYSKGESSKAREALTWLHGSDDNFIKYEIENIQKSLKEKAENKITLGSLLEKSILKPFLISFTMFVFLNLSGLNIMIFYCNAIFKYSGSSMSEKIAAIIVGIVLLVSSFIAIGAITKFSRKLILITSMVGMCLSYAVLGVCFYIIETNMSSQSQEELTPSYVFPHGWVPPLTIITLLFLGNGGYGTLVWVVVAEMLPPRVRAVSNAINICFSFVLGFVASKTFVDLTIAIGASGTFWLYGAVCLAGGIFTFLFVPETKGKSIEEIQKIFTK